MRLLMIIQVVQNSNQVLKNKKNNPGFVSDPTGWLSVAKDIQFPLSFQPKER